MRFIPPIFAIRLCVFYSLLLATAAGCPAKLSAQQYTFRQYGPSEGLTNLGINCLLQDRTGFLWVGTDNGLFRFDGKTFQPFGHAQGLPHAEIRNLAESPQGVLWVATQDGVARRAGNRFETVDAGVKGQFLGLAFDRKGVLYLEHSSGLVRGIPDGKPSPGYSFQMIVPGVLGGLYIDGQDVWFRKDLDLWRLNGDTPERIGTPAGLPPDRWGSIVVDSLGNLWVRSALHLYERPHGQSRFLDRSEGVPHALVTRLFADTHGHLFVSSNSGAVVFDSSAISDAPTRTYIDPKHGLPADVVAPVLIDRDESLWLGMRGGGLIRRLGHGEWLSWRKPDGLLNDSVWSVLHDKADRLWVGSNDGLNIFGPDGTLAHTWTSHNGLVGDSIFAITPGLAGDVFVGAAPFGISHLNAQGDILHNYGLASGLPAQQVNAIALDRQSRLWAAASGACYRSRTSVSESVSLKFDRVDTPPVPNGTFFHDVQMDDQGILWITSTAGLFRFDGSHWSVFTERDGLASSDVSAMTVAHNQVWVGYRDAIGMARLQLNGDRAVVTNFTQRDGLSSDLIYALAFDHAGRLWASTDNGANVLENGHWRRYGTEDGLIWDDGNDHALSVDEAGNVWIGTARGLSRFTPLPYAIPDLPSPVVLTSIQGLSAEFEPQDHPTLSHAQNSLLIHFSGLDFVSDSATRFRYRLLGSNSSWTDTRETSVHFEGLTGGHYTFEVVAANSNGQWSPSPARFAFTVKSPWWLTWWCIAGSLLIAILLARTLWRYRVRKLLAQKAFLEQQVIDRTAELRESHRKLEEIAYYDALTALPNRRMFTEQFRLRLALSQRHGGLFALLLIDLDTFKQINDAHGHDAGDAVLVHTANLLQAAVRDSDCVARLGGDEFAILLISPIDPTGIETACERIVASFAAGIPYKNTTLKSTCSVGIAVYPADGDTQETLYKSADLALYQAKRQGGNTCVRYQAVDTTPGLSVP